MVRCVRNVFCASTFAHTNPTVDTQRELAQCVKCVCTCTHMSVCKHKHIFAWHSERVYVRACSCFRMCLATIGSGWFAHACTCIEPKQSKFVRTMRTLISLNLCDLTYVLTTTAYLHTYAHIATKHACTHRHTHKL